jgi:uncharacterized damage-inducible protein DinB
MSTGLVQTYRAFAYNNAWANHRLLNACASLSQTQFEAKRSGFFPSLQLTLNHIYVIDLFYVDALEGGSLGPRAWESSVPCPSVADLQRDQAKVDQPSDRSLRCADTGPTRDHGEGQSRNKRAG